MAPRVYYYRRLSSTQVTRERCANTFVTSPDRLPLPVMMNTGNVHLIRPLILAVMTIFDCCVRPLDACCPCFIKVDEEFDRKSCILPCVRTRDVGLMNYDLILS